MKQIDALARGIEVLGWFEANQYGTLMELARDLPYAKATLLRILKTLDAAGRVHWQPQRQRYEWIPPSAGRQAWTNVRGESASGRLQRVLDLADVFAPAVQKLQAGIHWPVDVAVRDGVAMRLLDCVKSAPVSLVVNYRVLGVRPLMLISSLGRCYLAFCPDGERDALVRQLACSSDETCRHLARPERVASMVAAARRQGYATRNAMELDAYSPERFGAISVPVKHRSRVVACLSISWPMNASDELSIVHAHLSRLKACAQTMEYAFGVAQREGGT